MTRRPPGLDRASSVVPRGQSPRSRPTRRGGQRDLTSGAPILLGGRRVHFHSRLATGDRHHPRAGSARDGPDRARDVGARRAHAVLRRPTPGPRGRRVAGVGRSLHWHDLVVLAITYVAHRARHHGRLPPAVHPPQLQDDAAPLRALFAVLRLDGRRGPGDRVGRDPPQAPPLLRPARRPAQPPRRPGAGLARRAARARPRACRLDVPRQGHGQPAPATRRTCSPTATCASSAARSRSGSPVGLAAARSASAWP